MRTCQVANLLYAGYFMALGLVFEFMFVMARKLDKPEHNIRYSVVRSGIAGCGIAAFMSLIVWLS